ncbi:putative membrane protein [Rhizobium pisi]|uniref:DUF1254 domain-containing protein n=1 Tax=Rhizobium pisi TaxID=574561 RepID=A0A3R9C3X3_9HYPH|nr:DUF1254 domain-containing protein [Rhizobium pisi]MBB3135695.1 putative membrane protein [Rhizobium pisi]RSB76166.1 DUF1254 domain-containing protein [Rhizobium pisi]TCA58999.1 DUF1254 domain-containing protein [Rhizobium pisi]
MFRIFFAVLTGLFGAALLHLIIILSLPHFTGKDAATRIEAEGDLNNFYLLSNAYDDAGLANSDPFVRTAVCSFDVEDAPVHFTAKGKVPFWSIAIYDSASNEVFSMNDRTSVGGALDVLAGGPIQLTDLRKNLPQELQQTILVEMARPDGYAVLRTLAPQTSFDESARNFLSEAGCEQFTTR